MDNLMYRFGDYSFWPAERQLVRAGRSLPMPPKVFDGLYLLLRNHGNLVSRDLIIQTLWPGTFVSEANLTNIVVQLRKLLGHDAIETVAKFGYRFALPVTGEPGVNQEAYAGFLRGKELMAERSIASIEAARELFAISVAEDPLFATGWAWLGRSWRVHDKFKAFPSSGPNLPEAALRRAFAIDPDLACAHQFYTQIQVDSGQAAAAMQRLALRLHHHGEDPETLTGMVQVLRYCGLLDESIAAHQRAVALDPTTRTSVAHTYFLKCDFTRVFEHYVTKGYYLDAAAWAALGQVDRATDMLRERLKHAAVGMMSALMGSLLTALEGRSEETIALIEKVEDLREPEGLFYFARHCGMVNAATMGIGLLRRARMAGFSSPFSLERDPAFHGIRTEPDFCNELLEAKQSTARAFDALRATSDMQTARRL